MTDIKELVKRLRAPLMPRHGIEREAADALEAQAKEIAEQDYVLKMKWRAEDRAIKAWQAKTGEHLTWPDQAKLVEWLMDELHAERTRIAELEEGIRTINGASHALCNKKDARIAELEALVEDAYREGWSDGNSSDGANRNIRDEDWKGSTTRAALNGEK